MNQFLETSRNLNISFRIDSEGKLDIEAPKGILTPEIIATIKENRELLIKYLLDVKAQDHEGQNIPRAEEDVCYPLSSSQKRLWIMHAMNKESIAYNMHGVIPLRGTLDPVKYELAIKAVVRRHEILRTVFREHEGSVRQWILPADTFEIKMVYEDLRTDKERLKKSKEIIHEDILLPFDLGMPPLVRVKLLQTEDDVYLFYFNMHHIISDGWSMKVLAKDIRLFYEAFTKGTEPELKSLRIQYKDYASWQQQQLSGEKFGEHRSYWLKQLSGELPVLTLPFSKPRPPVMTHSGYALSTMINIDTTERLRSLCQSHQGTLFMGLLAVMNGLLYRYCGQEDIIIGSPVAGREHADLEEQIGFYINTLALRTRFNGSDSFSSLLYKVREVTLSAYNHQLYPFDSLIEDLTIRRDMSRSLVTDIVMVLQNQFDKESGEELYQFSDDGIHEEGIRQVKLDIHVAFSEKPGGLLMVIQYNSDVFEQVSIGRLMEHYKRLLALMTANPGIAVSEHEYILASERHQLLGEFNDTTVHYPAGKTILDLFGMHVNRIPEQAAVIFDTETLTYRELDDRSNQLARYLCKKGIQAEMAVPICMDRSADMIVAMLGILKAGGAYVPVDPTYPQERINYMLQDTNSPLIISQTYYKELFEDLADVFKIYMDRDRIAIDMELSGPVQIEVPEKSLAYVIYTSGSTGKPKGVMIEHKGVLNTIYSFQSAFDIREGERGLQFASSSFDASVAEIFSMLASGGTLYLISEDDKKRPSVLEQYITDHNIDFAIIPPAFLKLLEVEKIKTLKKLITAGEAALTEKAASFLRYGTYYNAYGPTETSICATIYRLNKGDTIATKTIPIGTPVSNVYIYILSSEMQLQPVGIEGEIFVGGAGLARGYMNRQDLTANKFVMDPFRQNERIYRTGDIGKWLPDGNIEFIGRIDDQVKVRGHRVELGEIETLLQNYPAIESAIVLYQPTQNSDNELVAYITSKGVLDITDLRSYVHKALPAFMIPANFIQLDELPITVNGKIDKKRLLLEGNVIDLTEEYVAPRNNMEQKMTQIWGEVLGREKVGIRNNFFDLGGDSIKILRMMTAMRKETGLDLQITDIYTNGTIENLAAHMALNRNEIDRTGKQLQANEEIVLNELDRLKASIMASDLITDKENIGDIYPMSDIEKGMVYEGLLDEKAGIYHDQMIERKKFIDFDIDRFGKALKLMVEKHPILRTAFNLSDYETEVQIIYNKINDSIQYRDLSDLPPGMQEKEIRNFMKAERESPFRVTVPPLWRMNVFNLGNHEILFLFQTHHAIIDGWSDASFRTELNNLYLELRSNPSLKPEPLKSSYKDYIVQNLVNKQDETVRNYWKNELAGFTKPDLFTDEEIYAGYSCPLSTDMYKKLQKAAVDFNTTVKCISLSAYLCMLKILNYENEIVVGLVTNNRPDSEDGDKILGCFLNTVPFKMIMDDSECFSDFIPRVQNKLTGLRPFERLSLAEISQVNNKLMTAGSPFFDIIFNYVDFHTYDAVIEDNLPGQNTEAVSSVDVGGYGRNNSLFTVTVSVTGGDYSFNARLGRQPASGYRVETAGKLFLEILTRITDSPGTKYSDLLTLFGVTRLEVQLTDTTIETAACSKLQERVWFIDLFEKNNVYDASPVYHNIPLVVKLPDSVNLHNLKRCIEEVVKVHSALHTGLLIQNSEPFQVIRKDWNIQMEVHKFNEVLEEDELIKKCITIAERPFDLEKDILARFDLVCYDPGQYLLMITAHQLVADRYSLRLLLADIITHYKTADAGIKTNEAVVSQYINYAAWQNALTRDDLRAMVFYWTKKLKDAPILYFETDSLREHIHIYTGALSIKKLSPALSQKIAGFSNAHDTSAFMVLLTAFNALLHRYTGSEDIVIGTLYQNRDQPVLKNMIGPVSNLLTLRNAIDGNMDFLALANQVTQDYKRSVECAAIPFENVVLEVNPGKDMSRTALFDIMVHYDEKDTSATEDFKQVEVNRGLGKYDLNLLVKNDDGFSFYLTYNERYFTDKKIERLLGHFINLVDQWLEQPELSVSQVNYMSAEEKELLLKGFNSAEASYPQHATLVELFEEQVERTPGNVAIEFKSTRHTYTELNEKANLLAGYLRHQYNIRPDDLVGIKLERSDWMIVAILAVLKSGGAYVPIDPEYPEERINYLVQDSNCKVLIDDEELQKFMTREKVYISQNLHRINKPDDLAYVIYTSGTTGNPKGTLVQHNNVVRLFKTDQPLFDFNETDVWTMFHSYCFDFSVWEMYGALLYGGKVIVIPAITAKDPAAYLNILVSGQVTILNQTPSSFYNIAREALEKKETNLRLRYIIFGGEALIPGKLSAWKRRYASTKLVNMYGITETTVHVTYKQITDRDIANNSCNIGVPIPTLRCYILDKNQQLLPVGIPGELYVGGAGVCRGYLNKPELTAARFIPSPFRAGDRLYRAGDKVRLLENGDMEYLGRLDDQVKIRGYRIELGEIESILRRDEKIEDVVVIARADEKGENNLAAYIVSKEKLNIKELRLSLAAQLPVYMLPGYFVQLNKLPLTSNGKIDKKNLPDPNEPGMGTGVEYIYPRNETEEKLVLIWQDILGKERIGVKDNFFELGGHSLRMTRLASQIHREFEIKIALKELFTKVTPEDQAHFIQQSRKATYINILPIPQQPDYIVSSSQRRLWVLSQFEKSSRAYHVPGEIQLEGSYSVAHLDKAIQKVIQRHEIMRTVFRENEDGELRQVIVLPEESSFKLEYVDFEGYSPASVRNYLIEQSGILFDMANGPLLRAGLIRINSDSYILHFNMHHIISDGWSMELLRREVLENYAAYKLDKEPERKPLRIQYKDYANWQQQQLSGEKFEEHRSYWLKQLSGELPVLTLPFSKPRPPVMTHNGYSLYTKINIDIVDKLRIVCQSHQGTLFMGLLAVMNGLLYRYCGQEDIIIGSPVAGREHADLEEQIGFYINTLALRTRFNGSDSFSSLLYKVREVTLSAYNHQLYPFDSLIEDLTIRRDMSRSAVFDVLVALQNQHDSSGSAGNAQTLADSKIIDSGPCAAKTDLHISFVERADGLYMDVQYNSDVFEQVSIGRLMEHYKRLLALMTANPGIAVSEHEYILASERHQLLGEFNDTTVHYPAGKTILDLFGMHVNRIPEQSAVIFDTETLTYRELDDRSNQLARYLCKKGIQAEMAVPICMDRSADMIVAILGILKAGGAYVPVDPTYPQERINYMLHDTNSPLIISQTYYKELFEDLADVFKIYMDRDRIAIDMELSGPVQIEVPEKSLAYVIYTSGSTGKPKGVMIEHSSLYQYINYCLQKYLGNRRKAWKVPLFTSLSFDLTVTSILGTLSAGGVLIIYPQEEPVRDILEDIFFGSKGINFLKCTPSHIDILQEFAKRLTTIEGLIAGGEELKQKQVSLLQSINPHIKIYNEYGPTEATVGCVVETIEGIDVKAAGNDRSILLIGKPASNTRIYILDAGQLMVPVGITGELYIGGAQLARGYLNRPDLTAERFIPDPFKAGERLYRSGDQAQWLEDGKIEFKGRIDDQVKINGYRIELGEVEHALTALSEITAACVIALEDEDQQRYLAAYVVSEDEQSAGLLREQLADRLPGYMIPSYFVQLQNLPLTINGKTDRKQLPDPRNSSMINMPAYVGPQYEMEEILVQIWKELFNSNRQIGIMDNFFEMGGNSLKAISLINKLKRQGYSIKIDDVLKYPTIEALATKVKALAGAVPTDITTIELIQDQSQLYDLSYNQRLYYNNKSISHSYGVFSFHLERFDNAKFAAAYHKLLSACDMLRLKFTIVHDKLLQEILPYDKANYPIRFIKKRKIDLNDEAIDQQINDFLKEPFDLLNGEVTRCGVLYDHKEAYIVISIHHISTDNNSNLLIKKMLLDFYYDREQLIQAPLFSYRDFIYMQQQYIESEQAKEKLTWWEQHLGSISTRNSVMAYDGQADTILNRQVITGGRFKKLFNYCISENVFPSTFMLSVFYIFICNEYPDMEEFIMEVVINGQDMNLPGFCIDNVVGLFSDSIPLKFYAKDKLSINEAVKYVQEVYLSGRLNQEIHSVYIRDLMLEKHGLRLSDWTTYYMNYISESNQEPMPAGYNKFINKSEVLEHKPVMARKGLPVKCYEYADGIVLDWETKSKPANTIGYTEGGYFLKKINAIIDTLIGHQDTDAEIVNSIEYS